MSSQSFILDPAVGYGLKRSRLTAESSLYQADWETSWIATIEKAWFALDDATMTSVGSIGKTLA